LSARRSTLTSSDCNCGGTERTVCERKAGGASVAKQVAGGLGLRHLFCDPDRFEREALGISTCRDREDVWASRLEPLSPNDTSIIFLCGANTSDTFKMTLERRGLHARVHCDDWTLRRPRTQP